MKFKLLLCVFILFTVIQSVSAHTNTPGAIGCKKNTITGGVIHSETKKPLGKVFVTVYSNTKKEKVVFTDVNGNYDFNDLKMGMYKLVFEKQGFQKITRDNIMIRAGEGCLINVEMEETTDFQIAPGPIVITQF